MDSDLRESEFMMLQDCPDAETLRRYLAGDEKISDFKALDNHIAKCSLCHNQLQQLALESDIMTKLVAESDKSPVSELPLDLQRALETIRKSSAEDRSSQSNSAESEFEHVMIRDYRVLELIGEGGMGSVYRAIHLKMNRPVAIKVLKCDRANASEAIARFTREMHLIAQLDHPNIVKALDAGEQEGLHYLVMEYIAGLNVNQLYRRLGPLPIPEACQIIQLATAGLRYAHERKIIHRDIKPSNFMVGSDGICKLLDLGLAQCFDLSNPNSVSRANQAVGTLAYMAPEQLSGVRQITAQCDVFSLGVSLHEILTGQRPMPQHGKTPWFADVQSIRPDVDTALSQFVKKMVSASPSDRPTPQEVENLMAEYADPANLASLVAEYYRWNRGRNSDPHSGSQSSPANHPTESMHAVQTLQSETNWLGNANQSIRVLTVIPRKARFNTMRAILRVAATLLVISLGTIAAWFFFSPNTDQPPPPPLMLTGELDIGPIGDVSKKLLEGGKVYAYSINKESEEVRLVEGVNQLPLGNYSIRIINGPEFFDDVNDIKIAKGPPLKQKLNPVLSKPFQFPSIPSRPGDFGNYHGTIKHADWDKGLGVEVTFNLHLEILSIEMSGDKLFKWLKIEIRANHASGNFTETGYLRIDSNQWDNAQFLDVSEGYVVASGESIARWRNERSPASKNSELPGNKDLIVKFNPNQDELNRVAKKALPKNRLSLQDILVLFFGDTRVALAAKSIGDLRPKLTEGGRQNSWIDDSGLTEVYVVSSRDRADSQDEKKGYSMSRTKKEPFGFFMLEVNTPTLFARCGRTNSNSGSASVTSSTVDKIAQLRKDANDPISEPPKPWRFDLAEIPNHIASSKWKGIISTGPSSRQSINATASMLDTELFDGKMCHWIDIKVESDSGSSSKSKEAARLLVNMDEYRINGFLPKKGWLMFDDTDGDVSSVFSFPTGGNLNEIIEHRLQLSAYPTFDRIGVIDVLAMLFDAEFNPSSSMSGLRKTFASNQNRQEKEDIDDIRLKARSVPGELFTGPGVYTIKRSKEIPFSFAAVNLNVGPVAVNLELSDSSFDEPQPPSNLAESNEKLKALADETDRRLAATTKPNWYVWTWTQNKKTYKAWAEFGGLSEIKTFSKTKERPEDEQVFLRNSLGVDVRVPRRALQVQGGALLCITKGREWQKFPTDSNRWLIKKDNKINLDLENAAGDPKNIDVEKFDERDKTWIQQWQKSKSIKVDATTNQSHWETFAPYRR